jgi:hypothetical protein
LFLKIEKASTFIYIKLIISTINYTFLLGSEDMGIYHNERQNGYSYTNGSLKEKIEKNKFVKSVRKKLMEERLKKQ